MTEKKIPIIDAVEQGNLREVKRLIAQGADLEAQDELGKNALIAAMYCTGTEPEMFGLVECLLKAGANLQAKDKFNRDAMYFAATHGWIDLVVLLQKHGAIILDSISLLTFVYHWPRHLNRRKRSAYSQILQLILNALPDLEMKAQQANLKTALHIACSEGLESVVLALLEAGADANSRDSNGAGPLESAANLAWRARTDNFQTLRALIQAGADVNNIGKNGGSALYWATYSGGNTLAVVNYLLAAGANPNVSCCDEGHSPLINAVISNREDLCLALLNAGADVNSRDSQGRTALAHAAELSRVTVLMLLLAHRADYCIADYQGLVAIDHAGREGKLECVKILQALPPIPEYANHSWSPLAQALFTGKENEIKKEIKHLGDLNKTEKDGRTALHIAIYTDQIKSVQWLLAAGAEVNPFGMHDSPLHAALVNGRTKIACLLIKARAAVNAIEGYAGSKGLTPLHLAIQKGDIETTKLLLKSGAEVNQRDTDQCSPLYYAAENNHLRLVKLLIAAGADVKAVDKYQRTSLHLCSQHSDCKVAAYLIKKGADVNAVYQLFGQYTVLCSAILKHNRKLVALLIRQGADLNWVDTAKLGSGSALNIAATKDENGKIVEMLIRAGAHLASKDFKGNSPLHGAIKYGSLTVTKCLIENGADLNAKNGDGTTPLMVSVTANKPLVFDLLMQNKVDLNCQLNKGWTVLHLAAFNGRLEMVRSLLMAGADPWLEDNQGKRAEHVAKELYGIYGVEHEKIIELLNRQLPIFI